MLEIGTPGLMWRGLETGREVPRQSPTLLTTAKTRIDDLAVRAATGPTGSFSSRRVLKEIRNLGDAMRALALAMGF